MVESQLGNGSINPVQIPTQVGSLTNWKTIEAGQYSSIALR